MLLKQIGQTNFISNAIEFALVQVFLHLMILYCHLLIGDKVCKVKAFARRLWVCRDLLYAMLAVILSFSGLNQRTTFFSRLLRQAMDTEIQFQQGSTRDECNLK